MDRNHRPRALIATIVFTIVASMIVPSVAIAAPNLTASSIGSFLIAADGTAQGSNVVSHIRESSGVLSDFAVSGLGGATAQSTVFSSVAVSGFTQLRKIEGAGSESITLVGSNAVITAVDSASSLLLVRATSNAQVSYGLDSGVVAAYPSSAAASAHNILELTLASGATLGHLILVPAAGAAATSSGFVVDASGSASGSVVADLQPGEAVVFRGVPGYYSSQSGSSGAASLDAEAQAYLRVVADLAAAGGLAGDYVSEFHTSEVRGVALDYFAGLKSESGLVAHNALRTTFAASGSADSAVVFQHDVDYEILAAQHAQEIAVYVNGVLAEAVDSASALQARAEADATAYYAFSVNGRTQVLTSVSSAAQQGAALGTADARGALSVVNVARFGGSTPGAESQAVTNVQTEVVGRFDAVGNLDGLGSSQSGSADAQAKFLGRFSSGVISKDVSGASIHNYVDLTTRTEVFHSVNVVGEVLAQGEAVGDALVTVSGPSTTIDVQDDIYSTTLLSVGALPAANVKKQVDFDLAKDVRASLVTPQVAQVEGPNGYVGWLVIAQASGAASSGSSFSLPTVAAPSASVPSAGAADLSAQLEAHSRLVFTSSSRATGYGAGEAIARGIAAGQLGAQALVGVSGQAVTNINADYFLPSAAHLETVAVDRSALDFNYRASGTASAATSFLVDTRGTALLAKGPEDVRVFVDGAEARLAGSAAAALAASAPSYYVDSSAVGTLMVLVNAASQARAINGADVSIVSALVANARANAAADLFGEFLVLPDGSAIGSYVQAHTDVAAGVVSAFTVTAPQAPTVVFSEIRPGVGAFAGAGASGASKLTLAKPDVVLTMTDQTSAIMNVAAEANAQVEFVLAQDVQAQMVSPDVVMLDGPNGFLGALVIADVAGSGSGAGDFTIDRPAAPSADVGSLVNVVANVEAGAQVVFKAFTGIETELDAIQRQQLANALAAGQIAGQVVIQGQATAAASLVEAQSVGTGAVAGSGSAVLQATTSFASTMDVVTAATTKEVTVTLSSALETGKTVMISLDQATLPTLPAGNIAILFDGQATAQASSYADVLDATDDGGVAEYFILTSSVSGASQVLVSVPHFSVHTVTIKEKAAEPANLFVWVSVALGIVVLAETFVLVRRRTAY